MKNHYNAVDVLCRAGFDHADAIALRRISMTLHRWHELECGDSNGYASWCITRGKKVYCERVGGTGPRPWTFEYDDDGKPYLESHPHNTNGARYEPIADREKGALKRLGAIMARYPGFQVYIQGDPRGAALYVLRPGDVREGASVDSCYTNGIAVCQ